MPDSEKGYFDFDAIDWVLNQYDEETWDDMPVEEQVRLINMEVQEREFIQEFLDNMKGD